MGVQIYIKRNSVGFSIVFAERSDSVGGRLLVGIRAQVISVQVVVENVHAVVTVVHAVRVQHRHDFEDVVFA